MPVGMDGDRTEQRPTDGGGRAPVAAPAGTVPTALVEAPLHTEQEEQTEQQPAEHVGGDLPVGEVVERAGRHEHRTGDAERPRDPGPLEEADQRQHEASDQHHRERRPHAREGTGSDLDRALTEGGLGDERAQRDPDQDRCGDGGQRRGEQHVAAEAGHDDDQQGGGPEPGRQATGIEHVERGDRLVVGEPGGERRC